MARYVLRLHQAAQQAGQDGHDQAYACGVQGDGTEDDQGVAGSHARPRGGWMDCMLSDLLFIIDKFFATIIYHR
jgi:hypothetical protein